MTDDLIWGLRTAVLGMGLVFALLALLWGVLTIVLRLDRRPAAAAAGGAATGSAGAAATAASGEDTGAATHAADGAGRATVQGMDAELLAAIVVATLAHRALRRREAAPAMRSYWPGSLLYASRWVAAGRARQNHSWQRRGRS